MKEKTYREVAEKFVQPEKQEIYVKYMLARWGENETSQCLTGYAHEWANRFRTNSEWFTSDSIGKKVLKTLANYRVCGYIVGADECNTCTDKLKCLTSKNITEEYYEKYQRNRYEKNITPIL